MSNKTNKEKANELAKKHIPFCGVPITECINAALEMAEWKEKQMIERAQDFIANWFYEHPHEQKFICSDEFGSIDQLLEKLKNAMEE